MSPTEHMQKAVAAAVKATHSPYIGELKGWHCMAYSPMFILEEIFPFWLIYHVCISFTYENFSEWTSLKQSPANHFSCFACDGQSSLLLEWNCCCVWRWWGNSRLSVAVGFSVGWNSPYRKIRPVTLPSPVSTFWIITTNHTLFMEIIVEDGHPAEKQSVSMVLPMNAIVLQHDWYFYYSLSFHHNFRSFWDWVVAHCQIGSGLFLTPVMMWYWDSAGKLFFLGFSWEHLTMCVDELQSNICIGLKILYISIPGLSESMTDSFQMNYHYIGISIWNRWDNSWCLVYWDFIKYIVSLKTPISCAFLVTSVHLVLICSYSLWN